MAVFGTGSYPTLYNVTQAMDPKGDPAQIVELLQQTNAPILDIPWGEGNLPTGEQTNVRTGIPKPIWRKWYQGVPSTKSEYARIIDTCGELANRSEVDKKAADFNGNSKAFRFGEALGVLEGMNQEFCRALFYGDNTLAPEQFNGLSPRFSSLEAPNGIKNIIDAGGTGSDNSSIWLICWGQTTVFGIYPKGSTGGLTRQDLGEIDCFDTNGDKYRGYADIFGWDCGLVVKDWRYIVRIANIDMSVLEAQSTGAADLIKLMVQALHRVPNLGIVQTGRENPSANGAAPIPLAPNPVFYTNRTIAEMLDVESLAKTFYTLKSGSDAFGRPVTYVRGIPVRTCDQLIDTEGRVF
jgi:hypothetical protein